MTGKHVGRMPGGVRAGLVWAAVLLAVVAAAGNFGHVLKFATSPDHGRATPTMGVIVALLPDVWLVLSLVKLRYDRRSAAAWVGLGLSVGFVGWATVRMTVGLDGRIVGLTPLAAACGAALLLELSGTSREAVTVAVPESSTGGVIPPVIPPDVSTVTSTVTGPVVEGVTGPVITPVSDAPTTRDVIAAAIARDGCTVAALVQVTGKSRSTVVDHLERLERDKEAVKGKDGLWRARGLKAVAR